MPADDIVAGEDGRKIVIVGDYRISIPPSLVPRSSADGRTHICFIIIIEEHGVPHVQPVCLFLPVQS